MSRPKKLVAASLAVLALAAIPATSVALSGSGASVPLARVAAVRTRGAARGCRSLGRRCVFQMRAHAIR